MPFDPFSDDPEPEVEETPAPETKPARTRKTTAKKETTVTENNENTRRDGLTLTFKGGSGFDAPWIVAHVSDLDAAEELLSDKEKLARVMEGVQSAGAYFVSKAPEGAARPGQRGGQAGGGGNNRGAAPQGATEHPGGKKAFCEHGERQFRSGITKTGKNAGKTWMAFDCPERVCDRQWDN